LGTVSATVVEILTITPFFSEPPGTETRSSPPSVPHATVSRTPPQPTVSQSLSPSATDQARGLSGAAIAGIAVGSTAILAVVLLGALFARRRLRAEYREKLLGQDSCLYSDQNDIEIFD
jgi:hypothetical protein